MKNTVNRLSKPQVRITLIYMVVASLWILLSDRLLYVSFGLDQSLTPALSMFKGLAFVCTTGAILYVTLTREFQRRHQAESELKAEISKVKRYQATLERSEKRHRLNSIVLSSIEDAVITADLEYNIMSWNDGAQSLYGWQEDEVIGKHVEAVLLNEYVGANREAVIAEFIHEGAWRGEVNQTRKDGTKCYVLATVNRILDDDGTSVGIVAVNRDITDRKLAEDALRESEDFLQAIFDHSLNAIVVADDNGNYISVNQATADLFGYPVDELLNMNAGDLRTPEESSLDERYQHFMVAGREIGEFHFIRPDGETRIATYHAVRIEDDFNLSILSDITARKEMEKELAHSESRHQRLYEQYRELTQQVVKLQEQERRRIAHELHDDLGQSLTAMRIHLSILRDTYTADTALQEDVDGVIALTQATTEKIRTLSYQLRPPLLDTLGLNAALQTLCENFADHTALDINYEGEAIAGLSDIATISLYRIVQESLNNVGKHANATSIAVTLSVSEEYITLKISDDGQGFNSDQAAQGDKRGGLGIVSMRDRAEMLKGRLDVESTLNTGTSITVTIPKE